MGVKLAIATLSNRHVCPQFMYDLNALTAHLPANGIKGVNLVNSQLLGKRNASELCAARHEIFTEVVKRGFTHLILFDDDTGFPVDICDTLFAHGKQVVGVNTAKKNVKPGANIYTALDLNGQPMQSIGKRNLEEASAIGMGTLLIDVSVLRNIPLPWFEVRWDEALQQHISETRYFTRKLRAHGVKLWIDHGLSHRIDHIGDQAFNYAFYSQINRVG